MNREQLREAVYAKCNGHCAYCGKEITMKEMQIDHVNPKWHNCSNKTLENIGVHRGTDNIDNLLPACRACNFRKGTMTVEQFRKELRHQCDNIIERSFQVRQSIDYKLLAYTPHEIVFYFEKLKLK